MSYSSISSRGLLKLLEQAIASEMEPVVIERLQWLLYFEQHKSITKTCDHFGIARTTFYRWARRFDPNDLSTLSDQPTHADPLLRPQKPVKQQLRIAIEETNALQYDITPGSYSKDRNQFEDRKKTILDTTLRDVINGIPVVRILLFLLVAAIGIVSIISNAAMLAFLLWPAEAGARSSFDPAILVNTESFQVVDEGTGSSDVYIQFGSTLNERITFNRSFDRFDFSDDVSISGSLLIDQNLQYGTGLTIDSESTGATLLALDAASKTADAPHISFGYKGAFDVSLYRHGSGGLTIENSETGAQDIFKVITDNGSQNNTIFRIENDGDVYADGVISGGGADVAEIYYAEENLAPGSIVQLDSLRAGGVKLASVANSDRLVGIVSTEPGVILRAHDDAGGYPIEVALIGRVPTRVSDENGPIMAGDYITASSVPGVGMKATNGGYVIAQALSDFTGNGEGEVMSLIKSTSIFGDALDIWKESIRIDRSLFVSDEVRSASITNLEGTAGIDEAGTVFAQHVSTEMFSGAGLVDCKNPNNKLLWNAETKQFICSKNTHSSGLSSYLHVYDSDGGQNLAATAVVTLDTIMVGHTDFGLEEGMVTILQEGDYEVGYSLAVEGKTEEGSTTHGWLDYGHGGSFDPVPSSSCWAYTQSGTLNAQSGCSRSVIMRLQSGDRLRLRAKALDSSSSLTVPKQSSISIKRLDQSTQVSEE